MPTGGKYSVSHFAKIKLQSAAHFESGKFFVIPTKPYVSFCSGATYLVFIRTIEPLRDRGESAARLRHVESVGDPRSARWRRRVGTLECERPGNGAAFLRVKARQQLRRFRPGAAGRFHENFLEQECGAPRERSFGDLSRNGRSPGWAICSLLVEQCPARLRRKRSSAMQDRECDFLAP